MLFRYRAVDRDGRIVEGEAEASTLQGVFQQLSAKQLRPVSVDELHMKKGSRGLWGGIKAGDKIFLTKYLSLMLRVGTDLLSAIDILIADFEKPSVKNLLLEIRDNLVHGRPFHEVFGRYPQTFSPVFVNLVKAAEAAGNLQDTFEKLSNMLAREADLRSRVRAAMIYPIVLVVISFVIFMFIMTFALPRVAAIFEQSSIQPPAFSRFVFAIGLFVGNNAIVITTLVVVLGIFGTYFFWKNPVGRKLADRTFRRTPLLRRVYQELAIQRFASTFSSLLKAGLPIVDALTITADTVGSNEVRDSLIRVSKEGLAKGLTIGQAFSREVAFPRLVTNLVAISEKAGHLEESLDTLAEFYSTNIDATIKTLMSFLEPVLLLIMGLLIGFVALSMIVPIYNLTAAF